MRRSMNAISLFGAIACLSSAAIITIDTGVDFDVAVITSVSVTAIAYSLWSFFYD
jgi:hypothetical protein